MAQATSSLLNNLYYHPIILLDNLDASILLFPCMVAPEQFNSHSGDAMQFNSVQAMFVAFVARSHLGLVESISTSK
jgi:hypothetical protein